MANQVGEQLFDWRNTLRPDFRQKMVNKIMRTLKRHVPFSGEDGPKELKKIAVWFEEIFYTSATSRFDYLVNISQTVLAVEKKPQNSIPNAPQSSSDNNASLDSTAEGIPSVWDWQEEVYEEIQGMKHVYLEELTDIYGKITDKLMQRDFHPMLTKAGQLEKLEMFRTMLERLINFLNLSKGQIQIGHKDKLASYENQIIKFLNVNRPRRSVMQGQALPTSHMHSMQRSHNQLFAAQRTLPEASSSSLDSTVKTESSNDEDWQEEVYQKIQNLKDTHLSELSEIHQKITGKLMQHDSVPQEGKADRLEKLKVFRTMLERLITFLNLSTGEIQIGYKDKLASYENQIMKFLNANRPRKPVTQGEFAA